MHFVRAASTDKMMAETFSPGDLLRMANFFSRWRRRAAAVPLFFKTGYVYTSERVVPDLQNANFFNHLKVYKFAAQFAVGKRVLDVGSGTGYGSDYLADFASSVTGIDYSRQAIRLSKKRYARPKFLLMDAHELAFPAASFDFIVSTENFEHLPRQAAHLREVRRVLAPGGLAMIATPNPQVTEGPNKFHHKENSYEELCALFASDFAEVEIVENSLPHSLDRPHGIDPNSEPLVIFGSSIDKQHLSNTHSFFCFCK
jgi:2-polyprenyl-3-methyl-5-hydroxy-6-metoxy-1,4-benzoquinol methylase